MCRRRINVRHVVEQAWAEGLLWCNAADAFREQATRRYVTRGWTLGTRRPHGLPTSDYTLVYTASRAGVLHDGRIETAPECTRGHTYTGRQSARAGTMPVS